MWQNKNICRAGASREQGFVYLKQVINQPGVEILLLEAIRNSFWNAPEMLIISSSANELGIVFTQFFEVNEI